MIEINLLPEEMKKKARKAQQIDLSSIKVSAQNLKNINFTKTIAVAAGSLIVLHITLFSISVFSRSALSSVKKAADKVMPEKKEYDALKQQVDLMNKKVRAIDDLMVNRFSWARKLNALSDSLTPGVWLTDLSYEEKLGERQAPQKQAAKAQGQAAKPKDLPKKTAMEKVVLKYLIITGYASSMGEEGTALVGRFIKSLKDNPGFYSDFSDIELGSIKSERVQDQEAMSFKITCLFKVKE